jgi:hypothetical protein
MNRISDHQQSVAPAPSTGLPHTPTLLVVADLANVKIKLKPVSSDGFVKP